MSISEQSYTNTPLESAEKDFEMEEAVSRKVLPRVDQSSDPSFFARWFSMVPPDAPVREEEYYWPSGQALDADNFSDGDFEHYLDRLTRKRRTRSRSGDSIVLNLPEFDAESSMSDGVSDSSYSRQGSIDSQWSESSVEAISPPLLERQLSDWTKMPSLLPPLKEVIPVRPPLEREQSDWNVMPKLLPPLPKREVSVDSSDQVAMPSSEKQQSDWSVMPQILPPLMDSKPSDTSDWVPIPEIVPAMPAVQHASWESLPAAAEMHSNTASVVYSSIPVFQPQFSFNPKVGYVQNGFASVPATTSTSTALVLYQPPASEAIAQAVAKSLAALYLQFSFYDIMEFYALAWHQPCTMFMTPSKTNTECYANYVYPILYIEKKSGRIITGYGHSQVEVSSRNFNTQNLQKPCSNYYTNYNNVDILRVD